MKHLAKLGALALAPAIGYLVYIQTDELRFAFLAALVTLAIVSQALSSDSLGEPSPGE